MDPMEATPTDTDPNPNTTQTPITQQLPPSSSTPSSIPSTPEFSTSSSSSSSMPTQNPQPQNPLQQQQQKQQQPNFQQPQQRPPLGRTRPNQPHYHFTPHLPPSQIGSSPSSSSSSSSSTFSSAPPPAVSAAPMQRGGLALGVPAHPTRPQQQAGSFSTFGSSPFNHQFGGLARNPINMQDQMGNPSTQGRQPMPGIQTIGMVGSLGSGSQLRPSGGISGHHPQRPGQPQLRTQAPSNNQSLANQKFQGPAMVRVQAMGSSGSSSQGTPQASQQHTQPWMKGQMNMSSLPPPANRPHMRPQTLQQRSQHPQQHHHQLPMSQHPHQIPSAQHQQHHLPLQSQQQQEQHGQQYLPTRIQQPAPHQQQATRAPSSAGQKSVVPTTGQPGTIQSGPIVPTGASTDSAESGNQILSKRTIHELVSQIDPSEKLDPSVEDALVEVAEDFIESITTIACSLAKHRKSTTLEAKDILLHLERNWNMTLPGYSGDEIKCCKKPFMNDIHKERLAAIKKSMIGTDTGNTKSSAGQAAGNPKAHVTKAPGTGFT